MLPCSSCGKCCTIFLGPMLIYRMLRLELMMDSTLFLLGRSCLQGNIFLLKVFLTIFNRCKSGTYILDYFNNFSDFSVSIRTLHASLSASM